MRWGGKSISQASANGFICPQLPYLLKDSATQNSLVTVTPALPVRAFPLSVKAYPKWCSLLLLTEILDELPQLPFSYMSFPFFHGSAQPLFVALPVVFPVSHCMLRSADVESGTELVILPVPAVQGGAISANS